MDMDLPSQFKTRMKQVLKAHYDEYIAGLNLPPYKAIRTNTLKTDCKYLEQKLAFLGKKTQFCSDGYYVDEGAGSIGNHPLHHAGAFYVQEPSAMSAVTALDPKPGERILDLCAAPGGKTTQIAAAMKNEGLIVANEFIGSRVGALVSNIERLGVQNVAVSCARPDMLCNELQGFFDKVLVDAPCSGEGMIRKDKRILLEWNTDNIMACAQRQLKILQSAKLALSEGGLLCYSTCTLAPEENEGVVSQFLKANPEFCLVKIEKQFGVPALPEFADGIEDIKFARRIFPSLGGEGHFVALMKKSGQVARSNKKIQFPNNDRIKIFNEFYAECFNSPIPEQIRIIGDKVYFSPETVDTKQTHIVRCGLFMGSIIKNRFEPSHALFAARGIDARRVLNLQLDDIRVRKFLHGEEISCDIDKGYTAVCIDSIPLGFGKVSNGVLKNHYPKGLRTF
ncbi:MAG: RsmB/NOP family class I SAM-dependent RNA methyltransferase [bacterium]|nr:RsmB/NOP family class I SAM-dependent RNA methyltransferase [bacterium]